MIKNVHNFTNFQDLNQILNEGRQHTNNNVFTARDDNSNSSSSTQNAKPNHEASFILADVNVIASKRMNRDDLINTAISLATSCTTVAHENIMDTINIRLKKLKNKEYLSIDKKLSEMATEEAEQINDFLCSYINGYEALYNKHHPRFGL